MDAFFGLCQDEVNRTGEAEDLASSCGHRLAAHTFANSAFIESVAAHTKISVT
jgi:hypothetical protein